MSFCASIFHTREDIDAFAYSLKQTAASSFFWPVVFWTNWLSAFKWNKKNLHFFLTTNQNVQSFVYCRKGCVWAHKPENHCLRIIVCARNGWVLCLNQTLTEVTWPIKGHIYYHFINFKIIKRSFICYLLRFLDQLHFYPLQNVSSIPSNWKALCDTWQVHSHCGKSSC